MPGPLRTEKRPMISVPLYVTPPGRPYRVRDGDTWSSIARTAGVGVWHLIESNFRTRSGGEVNWYLREYVGCVQTTPDGRNWKFSSGLTGGIGAWKGGTIWIPPTQSGRAGGDVTGDDIPDVVVGARSPGNAHVKA